jgi:hypothetical protein
MAKSTSRRVGTSTARIKTSVYLSPIAYQRLGAACVAEIKTQSDVVELLINRYLAGYVLSIRGERIGHSNGSANSESQLNLSESSAA